MTPEAIKTELQRALKEIFSPTSNGQTLTSISALASESQPDASAPASEGQPDTSVHASSSSVRVLRTNCLLFQSFVRGSRTNYLRLQTLNNSFAADLQSSATDLQGSAEDLLGTTADHLYSTTDHLGSTADHLGSTADHLGLVADFHGFRTILEGLAEGCCGSCTTL
ncbi:hypothetical protein CRENBAI_001852 [Crenichthys baileyi]|uniref:Uncharacterized protein n=1 Tax=Crenichthys baileyi TaxID=28760 RepID=A0AAV9RNQ6_9TELE